MKREIRVLFVCVILLLCLPVQAFAAINFDGNVLPSEWFEYPVKRLTWDESWCGITNATIQVAVQAAQSRVMFGFTAVASGVDADSAIGAAFLVNGREIGSWQQDAGASFDSVNYDLRGLCHIPENAIDGSYYTFEIALGYKTEAALSALEGLSVRLFGPDGVPSQEVPCPVVIAEPVTTTKAPTTEKTTTTKAPTTEKTTTTKAPTTEKTTTTKAPTTEKTTTTKAPTTEKPTTTTRPTTVPPTYTTAPPPVYTTAREVFSYTPVPMTTAYRAPAAPKAATTAQVTTQPGTSRTEVFYYTVMYTDAPTAVAAYSGAPGAAAATEHQTLWTYEPLYESMPAEASQPQSVPTLALPAPQPTRAASPSAALLFSAVGVLVLLAAGLIVFWARTQKRPEDPDGKNAGPTEEPASEPPDCPA